jgi:medium-chain acyl-[acyl-carrier-protein] hydrolase
VPFALFGHSMGALVSFELARRLDAEPDHLFVSARRAPHLPERMPPIAHLPDPEFVAAVQRRYAGIPQAVLESPDLLELLLFRLRADFEVLETYEHRRGVPLGCPISVFGGREDTTVSEADLAGWSEHTRSQVRTRVLSGPHLFLQEQRQAILAAIAEDLGSQVPAQVRAAV